MASTGRRSQLSSEPARPAPMQQGTATHAPTLMRAHAPAGDAPRADAAASVISDAHDSRSFTISEAITTSSSAPISTSAGTRRSSQSGASTGVDGSSASHAAMSGDRGSMVSSGALTTALRKARVAVPQLGPPPPRLPPEAPAQNGPGDRGAPQHADAGTTATASALLDGSASNHVPDGASVYTAPSSMHTLMMMPSMSQFMPMMPGGMFAMPSPLMYGPTGPVMMMSPGMGMPRSIGAMQQPQPQASSADSSAITAAGATMSPMLPAGMMPAWSMWPGMGMNMGMNMGMGMGMLGGMLGGMPPGAAFMPFAPGFVMPGNPGAMPSGFMSNMSSAGSVASMPASGVQFPSADLESPSKDDGRARGFAASEVQSMRSGTTHAPSWIAPNAVRDVSDEPAPAQGAAPVSGTDDAAEAANLAHSRKRKTTRRLVEGADAASVHSAVSGVCQPFGSGQSDAGSVGRPVHVAIGARAKNTAASKVVPIAYVQDHEFEKIVAQLQGSVGGESSVRSAGDDDAEPLSVTTARTVVDDMGNRLRGPVPPAPSGVNAESEPRMSGPRRREYEDAWADDADADAGADQDAPPARHQVALAHRRVIKRPRGDPAESQAVSIRDHSVAAILQTMRSTTGTSGSVEQFSVAANDLNRTSILTKVSRAVVSGSGRNSAPNMRTRKAWVGVSYVPRLRKFRSYFFHPELRKTIGCGSHNIAYDAAKSRHMMISSLPPHLRRHIAQDFVPDDSDPDAPMIPPADVVEEDVPAVPGAEASSDHPADDSVDPHADASGEHPPHASVE